MSGGFTLTPEEKAKWLAEQDQWRRGDSRSAAPAVDAPGATVEKWGLTRPSLAVCRRRFLRETDGRGRPYWLPIYNWLHPPDDVGLKGHPAGCAGPRVRWLDAQLFYSDWASNHLWSLKSPSATHG